MKFHVSLEDVSDETLEFLGYILIEEDERFRLYVHKGDQILVDKEDPFLMVDDLNDAALLGSEIINIG